MNKIRFTKMHGAGNDFILVDDRAGTFPVHDHLPLTIQREAIFVPIDEQDALRDVHP